MDGGRGHLSRWGNILCCSRCMQQFKPLDEAQINQKCDRNVLSYFEFWTSFFPVMLKILYCLTSTKVVRIDNHDREFIKDCSYRKQIQRMMYICFLVTLALRFFNVFYFWQTITFHKWQDLFAANDWQVYWLDDCDPIDSKTCSSNIALTFDWCLLYGFHFMRVWLRQSKL